LSYSNGVAAKAVAPIFPLCYTPRFSLAEAMIITTEFAPQKFLQSILNLRSFAWVSA
jgi:hypothetical protein